MLESRVATSQKMFFAVKNFNFPEIFKTIYHRQLIILPHPQN